ncbi:MAG: hypothetical protein R6X31_08145 [Anaerolineae bacterium]
MTASCPPSGSTHRYILTIFALDTELDPKAGATKEEVLDAVEGHVLAQGKLVSGYGR